MGKTLLLQSSEGKVLMAPTWDRRPSAAQALPVQTGIPTRALERVLQFWTKHALAPASGESPDSLARWDADFSRRLHQDGLNAEFVAAIQKLRLASRGRRPEATRDSAATTDAAPATRAAGAGADQAFAIGAHHGDQHRHARDTVTRADAAAVATPADVAAAARADLAVAWCAAARADPASALRAAGAGPVDVWCAVHFRGDPVSAASSDRAAASRAHGRQRAEEDDDSACHHRKRPLTKMSLAVAPRSCSSVVSAPAPAAAASLKKMTAKPDALAPAAASLKKMTAKPELSIPAPLSLRARRGLPELSCKCPKQIPPLAASLKKMAAKPDAPAPAAASLKKMTAKPDAPAPAAASLKKITAKPDAPVPAAASLKKMTAKPELSIPAPLSLRSRRGLPEISCKCPKQIPLLAASRKIRA